MKILKLFIISAVVLFSLLLAFSSMLPSTIRISRAININDSSYKISARIRNLNEWPEWNEYITPLSPQVLDADRIVSDKLTVALVSAGPATITTRWTQKNGKTFPGIFELIPNKSVTTVQWYFEFTLKWYPWEKFGSIIYDKELGPPMEKSLLNLKQLLEKAP